MIFPPYSCRGALTLTNNLKHIHYAHHGKRGLYTDSFNNPASIEVTSYVFVRQHCNVLRATIVSETAPKFDCSQNKNIWKAS